MPRLILHMGAPKTGSSALQAMLAKNADWLETRGIHYPEVASFERAAAGMASTGNGAQLGRMLTGNGLTDEFKALLTDTAKAGKTLLISSETLPRGRPDNMSDFRALALKAGYEIRVVFYVRALLDHLISGYRQFVKRNGFSGEFSDVLADVTVEPQLKALQKLAKVFDAEELMVRNYDQNRKRLAEDFFGDVLGIDDMDGFEPIAGLTNRSLTQAETMVVRELNVAAGDTIGGRVLSDMLMAAPAQRGPFVIGREDYEKLEARFAGQVEEINTWLGDQPIRLNTDDVLVADQPPKGLSDTEVVVIRLMGALMERMVESERKMREGRRNRRREAEED